MSIENEAPVVPERTPEFNNFLTLLEVYERGGTKALSEELDRRKKEEK